MTSEYYNICFHIIIQWLSLDYNMKTFSTSLYLICTNCVLTIIFEEHRILYYPKQVNAESAPLGPCNETFFD